MPYGLTGLHDHSTQVFQFDWVLFGKQKKNYILNNDFMVAHLRTWQKGEERMM